MKTADQCGQRFFIYFKLQTQIFIKINKIHKIIMGINSMSYKTDMLCYFSIFVIIVKHQYQLFQIIVQNLA